MLKWLVRLWQKIAGWVHPHQTEQRSYYPSNLHGRHR
jgi:hypothetical protein